MNAAFILQDIMDQKPFFAILTKRANMEKLFKIAFRSVQSGEQNENLISRYEEGGFVTQGLISRFVQQFNERQKQNFDKDRWDNSGDDDDIIVNEMSDDENEDSKNGSHVAVVELLT